MNRTEGGWARFKFMVFMLFLGAALYAGYLFLPVLYQAYMLRDLMQHDVDVAVTQGYPASWVREQLVKSGPEYGVPEMALIEAAQRNGRMEVRVKFTRSIQFPGYTYPFEFDHSAKSTSFLISK